MKKTLIIIGTALFVGIGATLAIQSQLPSKINVLETKLTEIDSDINLHDTQLQTLKERRIATICQLGAQKLADGNEVKNPKVFSQLCGTRLGLHMEN